MIQLTDSAGAFATRWFAAAAIAQREMLATALAALTTGLNVSAQLASTDEFSELRTLYVLAV
jgi:hypothetical protein